MNLHDLMTAKTRKKISEAGYNHGFADPTAPSLGGSRSRDSEGETEFDDKMRKLTGMIFYNVNDPEMASALGLKQTRTGKWFLRTGNRNAQQAADKAFGAGKVWYPKNEGVAEGEEMGTFAALKGLKSWQVVIMNNYYRGKYSDYSGRYYYVLATSPEEAKQVVLDNADGILQELLAMKSHNGKKILPRGSAVRITLERIGKIEDGTVAGRLSTAGFKRMFGPEGVTMAKLSGGAVVDIQGQEQGVAEGAPELLKAEMPLVRHIEQELTNIGYKKGTPEFNAYFNDAIKFYRQFGNFEFNKEQGVAEGSPTMWEVCFDYGPHMSDTVKVKAGSEDEAIAKVEKAAEKRGRSIDINWVKPAEQGVTEGADERKQNALWAQITAHEKAAAKSKDLKRQHHIDMANQLRSQLKTSDDVEEARRANTDSARAEFSNRPRKPGLSPAEQDKAKADSDAAWERLMAYADEQKKKEQGVAEGGFKNMYAEFSGYGNYMQGRAVNVFNKAGLEVVSKEYSEDDDIQTYVVKGDRWAIEKAGEFLERNPEQFGGYHFVKNNMAEDSLNEFAPGNGDDDNGGDDDALLRFAKMWYSAPDVATQQQVEQALAKAGWEIGELESEEGGAYVMRIGDEAGDSYIGWSEEQLADIREGAKSAGPGWMLRQDPVLAQKVKDSKAGHRALKKWAGKPVPNKFNDKPDDWSADFERRMSEDNDGFDTHIVLVTVSDPNATAVTQRGETVQKRARVRSSDRESAINTAINHYKKAGYKVHDHHYVGGIRSGATPRNEDNGLNELSNDLLGRYKKELGIRASAADKAGDYDKGHEYFKKINKATIRQGENDARKHEQENQNEMMETRLNMMRKAGYDL